MTSTTMDAKSEACSARLRSWLNIESRKRWLYRTSVLWTIANIPNNMPRANGIMAEERQRHVCISGNTASEGQCVCEVELIGNLYWRDVSHGRPVTILLCSNAWFWQWMWSALKWRWMMGLTNKYSGHTWALEASQGSNCVLCTIRNFGWTTGQVPAPGLADE